MSASSRPHGKLERWLKRHRGAGKRQSAPRVKSFRFRMVCAQPPPLQLRQVNGHAGRGPRSRGTAGHTAGISQGQPVWPRHSSVWDRSGGRTARQGGHPARRGVLWNGQPVECWQERPGTVRSATPNVWNMNDGIIPVYLASLSALSYPIRIHFMAPAVVVSFGSISTHPILEP